MPTERKFRRIRFWSLTPSVRNTLIKLDSLHDDVLNTWRESNYSIQAIRDKFNVNYYNAKFWLVTRGHIEDNTPQDLIDKIRYFLHRKLDRDEIAKKLKINHGRVSYIIHLYNLRKEIFDKKFCVVKDLWEKNVPLPAIAKKIGVSTSCISRWLYNFAGLTRRPRLCLNYKFIKKINDEKLKLSKSLGLNSVISGLELLILLVLYFMKFGTADQIFSVLQKTFPSGHVRFFVFSVKIPKRKHRHGFICLRKKGLIYSIQTFSRNEKNRNRPVKNSHFYFITDRGIDVASKVMKMIDISDFSEIALKEKSC